MGRAAAEAQIGLLGLSPDAARIQLK
jgi:hypothetical protein